MFLKCVYRVKQCVYRVGGTPAALTRSILIVTTRETCLHAMLDRYQLSSVRNINMQHK